jgi:hypothetical protein
MAFGCKPVDLNLMAFGWKVRSGDGMFLFGSVGEYTERTSKRWRDVPVRFGWWIYRK